MQHTPGMLSPKSLQLKELVFIIFLFCTPQRVSKLCPYSHCSVLMGNGFLHICCHLCNTLTFSCCANPQNTLITKLACMSALFSPHPLQPTRPLGPWGLSQGDVCFVISGIAPPIRKWTESIFPAWLPYFLPITIKWKFPWRKINDLSYKGFELLVAMLFFLNWRKMCIFRVTES